MNRYEAYRSYIELETDPAFLQGLSAMQRSKLAKQSAELERLRAQLATVEASYSDLHKMMQITADRRRSLMDDHLHADKEALAVAATPAVDSEAPATAASTQVDHELTTEIDDESGVHDEQP